MIGGDLRVDKYRFRARPHNKNFILFPFDDSSKSFSMFTAIMLLWKVTIDNGSFLLYEDIIQCGIVETLLILIAVMLLIQLSNHIYTRCWFYGTAYDFRSIMLCSSTNKFLKFIPLVLNILAYITLIAHFCHEIEKNGLAFLDTVWPQRPSFINKWFLLYFIDFITIVPSLFARKIITLTSIAYIGNIAKILALVCLVALLVKSILEKGYNVIVNTTGKIEYEDFPYLPFMTLFSKDPSPLFRCFGYLTISFYVHPFLSMFFADMNNPTVSRCLSATWISNSISVLFYFAAGAISYFIVQIHLQEALEIEYVPIDQRKENLFNLFFTRNKRLVTQFRNLNVFYNFNTSYPEAIVGQVSCYIISITSIIFYSYFVASQLSDIVIDRKKDDMTPVFISGVVIILFAIGANFMPSIIFDVLDTISMVAVVILVFFLPAFFYLKLFRFTIKFWGVMSVLLMVVGIPIGIVSVCYQAIYLRDQTKL